MKSVIFTFFAVNTFAHDEACHFSITDLGQFEKRDALANNLNP